MNKRIYTQTTLSSKSSFFIEVLMRMKKRFFLVFYWSTFFKLLTFYKSTYMGRGLMGRIVLYAGDGAGGCSRNGQCYPESSLTFSHKPVLPTSTFQMMWNYLVYSQLVYPQSFSFPCILDFNFFKCLNLNVPQSLFSIYVFFISLNLYLQFEVLFLYLSI